jgi:hypothetical protein
MPNRLTFRILVPRQACSNILREYAFTPSLVDSFQDLAVKLILAGKLLNQRYFK